MLNVKMNDRYSLDRLIDKIEVDYIIDYSIGLVVSGKVLAKILIECRETGD